MKRIMKGLFTLAMMALASSSWAFVSKSSQTITAQITTGGSSGVTMNIGIRNISNINSTATTVGWAANVDPSGNTWVIATQVIKLDSNITDLTGGIQLVTDNKSTLANPKFFDPSPTISSNTDSNPAGLVLATGTASSSVLPLAWSVKNSTVNVGVDMLSSDPNTGSATGPGNRYQWIFVADRQTPAIDWNGNGILGDTVNGIADTPAFTPGQDISRVVDARGIQFSQATFGGGLGSKTSWVYFETNVATALPQVTYKTNSLIFEAFTQ